MPDHAGVIVNLGSERCRVEKLGQVIGPTDLGQVARGLEMLAHGHAISDTAGHDPRFQGMIKFLMRLRIEIIVAQDFLCALERIVVEQDRAQHRRLGRQIVRRLSLGLTIRKMDFAHALAVAHDAPP